MKLKYYKNLDGVRGIAALMVVVFHFFIFPNSNYLKHLDIYQKITEFGQHGVSLFFVLSGFVITRILLNTRTNQNYFRSFYLRRVLRILPLYYLFLFVYYAITPFLLDRGGAEFRLQLPYYCYIQNFQEVLNFKASGPGHYWSLAVEEHFYLLWPMAIYLIKPKRVGSLIGISIISVIVLKYFMLKQGLSINYFTFTRIDQILIGAYLAVLELNGYFTRKNSVLEMSVICLLALPLAAIVYLFSANFPFLKEITKYLFLGLIFFGLLGSLIALKETHIINKALSGRVIQYLGRISYGIYVWHFLALMIQNKIWISKLLFVDLMTAIGLSVLLAHLSFSYYEKLFLRLKEKKTKKPIGISSIMIKSESSIPRSNY